MQDSLSVVHLMKADMKDELSLKEDETEQELAIDW